MGFPAHEFLGFVMSRDLAGKPESYRLVPHDQKLGILGVSLGPVKIRDSHRQWILAVAAR